MASLADAPPERSSDTPARTNGRRHGQRNGQRRDQRNGPENGPENGPRERQRDTGQIRSLGPRRPGIHLNNAQQGELPKAQPEPHSNYANNSSIYIPDPSQASQLPDGEAIVEPEICFICANAVTYYSIAPCNHRTCHICGLRMRALYKTKDCTQCRTPSSFVIFSKDGSRPYNEFSNKEITSVDTQIGIRYTSQAIAEDTVLLLCYNCPDPNCDFHAVGWADLSQHVRSIHRKRMCELCLTNHKVFTHEHDLFSDQDLTRHLKFGDDRRPGAAEQSGFKGHPLCSFCKENFYDDDKLFEHCRERHERCYFCDDRNTRQPHYFADYNALELHFRDSHFACLEPACIAKRFVFFDSEMDLKGHQLDEHGNTQSKDVRKDTRIVNMATIPFRERYLEIRNQAGSVSRDRRTTDTTTPDQPAASGSTRRGDRLPVHSTQPGTARTFGGQLSSANPRRRDASPSLPPPLPPVSRPLPSGPPVVVSTDAPLVGIVRPSPEQGSGSDENLPLAVEGTTSMSFLSFVNLPPERRALMTRHSAVLDRATSLLQKDDAKIRTFRAHISSFKEGNLSPTQFFDTLFSLFSSAPRPATITLVREVADLFEDPVKADGLRKALQDWRAIHEDFPSLSARSGLDTNGGPSNGGWAATAAAAASSSAFENSLVAKPSTRVLSLKKSTRRNSPSSSALPNLHPPPSSAFPALPSASSSTPHSSSTAAAVNDTDRRPVTSVNEEAFPALPTAPRLVTTLFGYGTGVVKRGAPAGPSNPPAWGGAGPAAPAVSYKNPPDPPDPGDGAAGAAAGAGKKKKGKGKRQLLAQWG